MGWSKKLRKETHALCTRSFLASPRTIIASWVDARARTIVCQWQESFVPEHVRQLRVKNTKGSNFRVLVLRRHLHSPLSRIPICSEISNTCCSAGNLLPMSLYGRNTSVSGWLPGKGDPTGSCSRGAWGLERVYTDTARIFQDLRFSQRWWLSHLLSRWYLALPIRPLKMKAIYSSETSDDDFQQTTQRYIPEVRSLQMYIGLSLSPHQL
jgi:hypothetical protein